MISLVCRYRALKCWWENLYQSLSIILYLLHFHHPPPLLLFFFIIPFQIMYNSRFLYLFISSPAFLKNLFLFSEFSLSRNVLRMKVFMAVNSLFSKFLVSLRPWILISEKRNFRDHGSLVGRALDSRKTDPGSNPGCGRFFFSQILYFS